MTIRVNGFTSKPSIRIDSHGQEQTLNLIKTYSFSKINSTYVWKGYINQVSARHNHHPFVLIFFDTTKRVCTPPIRVFSKLKKRKSNNNLPVVTKKIRQSVSTQLLKTLILNQQIMMEQIRQLKETVENQKKIEEEFDVNWEDYFTKNVPDYLQTGVRNVVG